ncbi:unnamed protein product (macronuclear) [Paramecium tetraurelia]|uniref:Uncharacterized protein n=1 Tax=Paramecium tetraurelia TaxID=5888 RepID=A0CV61_PARTE|nr:uncharacterized protein GSPATT00010846001 [Paramecium tetraurelia]CAK74678.1 unnamed protein product [Paramecium tetraurelia]|eukprot:XP_001442075.1 hypothetical protein (macronuclear) [Paramecium tetraurelia strain d4-2]
MDRQFVKVQAIHWMSFCYSVYFYLESRNTSNLLCLVILCLIFPIVLLFHYAKLRVKIIGTIFCIQIDLICLIILNYENLNHASYAQLIICQYLSKDLIKQVRTQNQLLINPMFFYYGLMILVCAFQQIYLHTVSKFGLEQPQLMLCLLLSFQQNVTLKKKNQSQLNTTIPIDGGPMQKLDSLAKRVVSVADSDKNFILDQSKESARILCNNFSNIQQHYINSEIIYNSLDFLQEGLIVLDIQDEKTQSYKIQYVNNATRILFGREQEGEILYILESLNTLHIQGQDISDDPSSRRESVQQRLSNLQHSRLCKSIFLQKELFCSVKQPLLDFQMFDKYQTISMKDLLERMIQARRTDVITVNTHFSGSISLNTNKNITISQSNAGGQSRHEQNERLMEFTLTLTKDRSILIICRDVTHRQKIRYLKDYDIQKSKMLSFVSHEYRQPLGCIIQMIECVLLNPIIKSNQEIAENLQIALDNSKYMLNLSNDLLDLAQIKNGKFKINKVSINIENLIKDCIKMFALKARLKDLQLLTEFSNNIPKLIMSDKNRLKQIIVNLLSNAFKFTCSRIEVIISLQSAFLRIGVRDDGIGISNEEQQMLFKAFSKVNSEESRKLNEQGVGLGLVISNQIAQTIGCTGLNIESKKDEDNHYSFFYFDMLIELPEKKKVAIFKIPEVYPLCQDVDDIITLNQEQQKITQDIISYCTHCLIVDDECFNVYAFNKILKGVLKNNNQQIDVESALSGKESIEKVKNKKCNNSCQGYKLIFMDVEMPILNGIQTTKQILALNPSQIVIGCSGYSDYQDKKKCLDAGMSDYITKPVSEIELQEILKRYL